MQKWTPTFPAPATHPPHVNHVLTVQAYDVPDGHLCLHDIVEVVGVLSHAPELVAWHMGEDEEQAHDNEMGGHNASDMCEQEVPRMLQNLSINQQATSQVGGR